MRKSSAIRAAMRLRKWCIGRNCNAGACVFCDSRGTCMLLGYVPALWPAMSFEDEEMERNEG